MPFIPLSTAETDAKSPMDDNLWLKVKDNFDDLNSRIVAAGSKTFLLELQGRLSILRPYKRSICSGITNFAFQPTFAKYLLKKSGSSGNITFDLRRTTSPDTPIIGIDHQYTAATQSIANTGTAINTQSIARATAQIATQSITHAKSTSAIQSIINVGGNFWQYNLNASFDSDTVVGDSILVASATAGANNGTFVIVEKDRSNGSNFVVSNASGVAQTGVAGTAQPKIMSYNYVNPVNAQFAVNEIVNLASHTTGANNSNAIPIFKINQSGNNIWIKNPAGVVQAGAAGTADCNRWIFTYSTAVLTTDYIINEAAKMAAHTSGGNNGNFNIVAINSSGNNLIVYNPAGVVQAGAAGNANTNRWTYALPTDPSSQIIAGDTVFLSGHTNILNDGVFSVGQVNRSGNNIVIYNPAGVVQAGAVGNVFTTRKLIKFATDQSAIYTALTSFVEIQGCPNGLYNFADGRSPYQVLQVNRGGGANYNIVLDVPRAPSQASPAGYIQLEMKSIFSSLPSLAIDVSGNVPNQNLIGSSTSFVTSTIPENTPILLYIISMMGGDPRDLTVTLT
ncbi:MAG: hypothetical protein ACK5YR_16570 [Pirellula sp.]